MIHSSQKHSRRRSSGMNPSSMSLSAECSEPRVLLSAAPIDGVGNNNVHPQWGSTEETFLRLAEAEYADSISAVGGEDRPGAREISNSVSDSNGKTVISDRLMSAMIYTWGQFIDHDMTLTKSGTTDKMSIPVPAGDRYFDPQSTGTKTIDTMRSAMDSATGTSEENPGQQINEITAFLDGSMIYGSDATTASSLRTFAGGLMKTSEGNLLPVDKDGMFQAGDVRVNENPGLTSLQTVFVREHNYQAAKIAAANPKLSDEALFQAARSIVVAEIQAVTYNEWLPSLMGRGAIEKYEGYDSTVNPGISNEFATAAFRFGHSLLGDEIEFFDNNGLPISDGVTLSQAFFNPSVVTQNGIDSVLKYLTADPSSELDTQVVDGVRNFLFGPPGAGGLDLASLNIQRGRDHGLADYNDTREAIGLTSVTSFAEITSDVALQEKLQTLYKSVDDIDLWVGGLAEDHVKGSSLGATFQAIIAEQFTQLRDGDRFWYKNQFSGRQLAQLQRTSLSDIIERNTRLNSVQQNAFFFKAGIAGDVTAELNADRKPSRKEPPVAKLTVSLINTDGDTIAATTTTDRRGHYQFGVMENLRTGVYRIQVTKADGTILASSRKVAITRGDDFERINLSVPVPSKPSRKTPGPTRPSERTKTPPTHSQPTANSSIAVTAQARPPIRQTKPVDAPGKLVAKSGVSSNATGSNSTRSGLASFNSSTLAATSPVAKETNRSTVPHESSLELLQLDELFATMPKGLL
ncbi:MAG: LEPR-XLL domain-containing protein [Planctomycetota bacterium]|nr:MAG: LEPR-XLL domain-containing protein [Planctomycetota bacterium]